MDLSRRACAMLVLAVCALGCGGSESPGRTFTLNNELTTAQMRYTPGPPENIYDSVRIELQLRLEGTTPSDSLFFELLPAENGWSRVESSHLIKQADGWYHGAFWIRPTVPGQFVTSWQTIPFTGFTSYMVARYDSLGRLREWGQLPEKGYPSWPLLVRDTMEVAYRFWPQVWTRRLHLVKRTDVPREFYVITQSYQRSRGVSGRRLEFTANLIISPEFPLRTRTWEAPGWVVDTLSVWVRDTLVAWMSWNYDEFVDNWEKNSTLFRDWQHRRQPELYFKVDADGHLEHVWTVEPAGQYVAAKMYADTSRPSFDSLKSVFIASPAPGGP